jgi:hypothetical protein
VTRDACLSERRRPPPHDDTREERVPLWAPPALSSFFRIFERTFVRTTEGMRPSTWRATLSPSGTSTRCATRWGI